jgi:hypothetical protein
MQHRSVPDPSDPWAYGGPTSIGSTAGVTRNFNQQLTPDNVNELPRALIQLENVLGCPDGVLDPTNQTTTRGHNILTCNYTTAGFRLEVGVPVESMERYRFIYGEQNICDKPECGGGRGPCLEFIEDINPETQLPEEICIRWSVNLRITDFCEGELMGYSGCTAQAAQIVHSSACEEFCIHSGRTGCSAICSQEMLIPGYAAGTSFSGGQWRAPAIEGMFAGSNVTSMGVQPDKIEEIVNTSSISKSESPGGSSSSTNLNVTETISREFITSGGTTGIQVQNVKSRTTPMSESW